MTKVIRRTFYFKVVEEVEVDVDTKYFLKKPVELKSKFLEEMHNREIRKQVEAQKNQELAELAAMKEFEKPWPDDFFGEFLPFF